MQHKFSSSFIKNCWFVFVFSFLFSSCDSKRIFEQNTEIVSGIWNNKNIVKFEVNIADTITPHNFYINVRNAGSYPYSNLYLFLETEFPNKTVSRDTVECILADDAGKWMGDGSGDIWDNRILFKKGVRFRQAGKYIFSLEQAMRVQNLPMIMDVGVRIEKQ